MSKTNQYWNVAEYENSAEIRLQGHVGRWDDINSRNFIATLNRLSAAHKKIIIRLNSQGGSVFEGLQIHAALKSSTAEISIVVESIAASIASVFLMGVPKERRSITRSALIMTHQAKSSAYGNADKLREEATVLDKINKNLISAYVEATGKTESVVKKWVQPNKDKWFDAQEAVDNGLVGSIVDDTQSVKATACLHKDMSEDDCNSFFNSLEPLENTIENQPIETPKMEKILAQLGMNSGDNQSDIVAKLVQMKATAAEKDKLIGTLQGENKGYKEAAVKAEKDALASKIDATIEAAKKENKVTAVNEASYRKLLSLDFDNTLEVINGMTGYKTFTHKIADANGGEVDKNDLANADWDTLTKSKKGSKHLKMLKKDDPTAYAELYEAKFGKQPTQ